MMTTTMPVMTSREILELQIRVFYQKFEAGAFVDQVELSRQLEILAEEAWSQIDYTEKATNVS